MRLPKLPGFKNRYPRRVRGRQRVAARGRSSPTGDVVDVDALVAKGVIKSTTSPVKVLGDGELTKKLTVQGRQGLRPRAGRRSRRPEGRSRRCDHRDRERVPRPGASQARSSSRSAMIALYRVGAHIPVPGVEPGGDRGSSSTSNGALGLLEPVLGRRAARSSPCSRWASCPTSPRRSSCSCCRASSRRSSSGRRKARPGSARSRRSPAT